MNTRLCTHTLLIPLFLLAAVLFKPLAAAQPALPAQYRGFWVDTFNTPLNNHNDVLAVINNIKSAKCNAVFVQVRRRGDSWYLNSLEPRADRVPIEAGFDPLADLIREAHAEAIEVHAFVIIGAVWNADPASRAPESASHVFNQHGFNQATGRVYEGRANWLTRTLLPDTTGTDVSIRFGGHRFGNDFWIDLGHTDAADYTLRVLLHLVRNYDLDGLHLDRIRYPEISVSGQTQASGVNIGYNETSVARFNKRYGFPVSALPAQNDPQWGKWRRDQVTNFVRRVYLNAVAVKPRLKVSAATIAFGGGPATLAGWEATETYWRVFQDWRAWMEEGILDLNVPMVYKREHQTQFAAQFDSWHEWAGNNAYDRLALMGAGAYLNSIEGTLRQTRRAVAVNAMGKRTEGVVFFSFAVPNEAVTANPLSLPANQNTPRRAFAEFAAGLTTGKSADGSQSYENKTANPEAVFAQAATIPVLQWKTNPQVGHLMGIARTRAGEAVDTGEVTINRVADGTTPAKGRTTVTTTTDGNGFYGGVDLAPGKYRLMVTPPGESAFSAICTATVAPGSVTTFDVVVDRAQAELAAVSAASFCGPALAPESIASAFSNGISTSTAVADTVPLPTQLGGASLAVKDGAGVERLSPLFFVSPGQMNFQVPPGTTPGAGMMTLTTGSSGTRAHAAPIATVAPGLFSANANGSGAPAAVVIRLSANGSLIYEPAAVFDPIANRFVPRPIDLGGENDQVFLALFGTGWRFRSNLANVMVRVDGVVAEVFYAGEQGDFVGLDQVNWKLPRSLAGRGVVEVVLFADGYSSNAVQISVK